MRYEGLRWSIENQTRTLSGKRPSSAAAEDVGVMKSEVFKLRQAQGQAIHRFCVAKEDSTISKMICLKYAQAHTEGQSAGAGMAFILLMSIGHRVAIITKARHDHTGEVREIVSNKGIASQA